MDRMYPSRPIVAVGGILIKENRLLLGRRKKSPDEGKWSIPGGAVEIGESLIDALRREMKEECKINVIDATPFIIIDRIYRKGEVVIYQYSIIDFLIRKFSGLPTAGSDALELKFFSEGELTEPDVGNSIKEMKEAVFHGNPGEIVYRIFDEQFKET